MGSLWQKSRNWLFDPFDKEWNVGAVLLDTRAFSYYDVAQHDGNTAPGDFSIPAGGSSVDIQVQGTYFLNPGQENR